ncbi:pyridoxamine 5'-phosphate oxidase family protein [Actinoplanes sp. CA-015351]|uniref:pyridoxamine 5'-phosphate oxidase family protein n=1 Tax=Actinoplanes sp. CA-015351 TaxID=3239897 RepID=UPI003D999DE9
MSTTSQRADAGFHAGEIALQRQAGVRHEAARLAPMLEPAKLSGGVARFLAGQTFMAVTGRDATGRLWTSALTGPPGFLDVRSGTELAVHTRIRPGDPLHGISAGQKVGTTAVDFARRRRVRINGELTVAAGGLLLIDVEQAFGNCPQHIHQRVLTPDGADGLVASGAVRRGTSLEAADVAVIRAAGTFLLGTMHPERGADASHRGGPAGFVGVDDGGDLWWPDFPGNNLFNSLGNLAVSDEAALLFPGFDTGSTLQLSGTARVEWGQAGRVVRFHPEQTVVQSLYQGAAGSHASVDRGLV